MKLIIESNTKFIIETLSFNSGGELHVVLRCGDGETACRYRHESDLGAGAAEERPRVSLLDYSRSHALRSDIKPKTRDSYRHMTAKLEEYGDRPLDEVTTEYLQGYISHLQSAGLKPNTVRLYFQKLACVLHDAYKHDVLRIANPYNLVRQISNLPQQYATGTSAASGKQVYPYRYIK